ncbi:MAG: hypothetical protein LBH63_02495 [Clostridiales Family XIII bacterium]|jgi:hypothetical protein|nr:hypothetical protein [Clostridiales Family XIII bacterium]
MTDIAKILARTPAFETFYTVDEMDALALRYAEDYPGSVSRAIVGASRKGHPIYCLSVGSGERNALCFACPHPNEPIGAMTCFALLKLFLEDPALLAETDFAWHFVYCADPDGTKLNEGWFKGPFTLRNYARHYYRPASDLQVEWTFPIDYKSLHFDKPIPETQALMGLIDELKPEFAFSLHNSSFGGAYWYSVEKDAKFCRSLETAATRQGIPLHLGEPESDYIVRYSPAVYSMMSMKEYVDYAEKYANGFGADSPTCGACSADYISGVCDCLTLIAEVPYFYNERIDDTTPSDMTRRDAILAGVERSENLRRLMQRWRDMSEQLFSADNPFPGLLMDHLDACESMLETRRKSAVSEAFDVPATVSEVRDNLYISHYNEYLFIGLLIRAVDCEEARRPGREIELSLRVVRDEAEAALSRGIAELEKEAAYSVIPIKKSVSVQIESAFAAIAHLNDEVLQ